MKRAKAILLFIIILLTSDIGYCGTVAYPYAVGSWPGFRSGAVTYTFDDGCSNQYAIAIPMFNEFGFKMTLYPVINWGPNWTALQNAAAAGHEVGSHTMSHPNFSGMSIAAQTQELVDSQNAVNSHITGQQCRTIAYPFCAPSDQTLTAQYYIAARHCQGNIESTTPSNMYQISSIICGNAGSVQTAADFNTRFASVASSTGWCVFLIHGIDNDGGYSPLLSTALRASLQYLDTHRNTLWVSTFGNVAKYIKERNSVSVAESNNSDNSITLQVTDTLDNAIYNYPITIRRPLTAGWTSARVSQNGQTKDANVVEIHAVKYIMFDAVPDGGDVVISKPLYGDFTGDHIIEMSDLYAFLNLWLINDCDQTAGMDLDEDCVLNFYEYASLAANWQQAS
jgi:hypothetical protein